MTVRLVHGSVKQFLRESDRPDDMRFTMDAAQKMMADIIVTYLNYDVFDTQISTTVIPKIQAGSVPSTIIRSGFEFSRRTRYLAVKLLKSRTNPNFDMSKTLAEAGVFPQHDSKPRFHFFEYARSNCQFHVACTSEKWSRQKHLLLRLLNRSILDLDVTSEDSNNLFLWAAKMGHDEIVKVLLDSGRVDPNSTDSLGHTPLHQAVLGGNESVIKQLLASENVNSNLRDNQEWTPLNLAIRYQPDTITRVLVASSKVKLAEMDEIGAYLPLLNRIISDQTGKRKLQLVQEFQEVVGTILMLQSPLSIISLSRLTHLDETLISLRLDSLHSVIHIPDDRTMPVQPFHLSFRDFLLDPETRQKTLLWVDEKETHQRLASRCLSVCNSLRRNICELSNEGTQRVEIDHQTVGHCLSPELQYSCRFWAQHLIQSKDPASIMHDAFLFLQKHFLHWMEAMSLLGLEAEVVGIINQLQSAAHVGLYENMIVNANF